MNYLHLFMATLAVLRMTDLFAGDRIMETVRQKFPSYLWTCVRCLSVWAGIAATLAFVFCPWLNWPFAFSWLYLMHNDFIFARRSARRQFVVEVDSTGNARVVKSGIPKEEVMSALGSINIA